MNKLQVLIIGETKKTKEKVWNYYKKLLKIEKEAEVFSSDLNNSDFDCDWNYRVSILKTLLENKFDVIIGNNIIEHLYNLEPFFKACRYHLNQNGIFVIRTDNALYFPYYIPIKNKILAKLFGVGYHSTNLARNLWNENHYHVFTKSHLTNLLTKFGFKIEKIEYGVYKFGIKKFITYFSPRILVIARK